MATARGDGVRVKAGRAGTKAMADLNNKDSNKKERIVPAIKIWWSSSSNADRKIRWFWSKSMASGFASRQNQCVATWDWRHQFQVEQVWPSFLPTHRDAIAGARTNDNTIFCEKEVKSSPCSTMRFSVQAALLLSALIVCDAFIIRPQVFGVPSPQTALFAKKKQNAKFAALEALEALEERALEEPLSKKEQRELAKKAMKQKQDPKAAALAALDALDEDLDAPLTKKEQLKAMKAAAKQQPQQDDTKTEAPKKQSSKEAALERALAMEEADAANSVAQEDEHPKLSKKELKALKKKEEKLAAKLAQKQAKKGANQEEAQTEIEAEMDVPTNGEAEQVRYCVRWMFARVFCRVGQPAFTQLSFKHSVHS